MPAGDSTEAGSPCERLIPIVAVMVVMVGSWSARLMVGSACAPDPAGISFFSIGGLRPATYRGRSADSRRQGEG
jgi:hypothetical protein